MTTKIPYTIEQKYGCVTRKLRGVIYVGENNPYPVFKTKKEIDEHIKKNKLPVVGNRKIHEVIPDEENLRKYAHDNGIPVPAKVPKQALEKIREAIDKELKKRHDEADFDSVSG